MEIFYSTDIHAGVVRLDAEESAHCVKVLRHREGDSVNVIDGKGNLYGCRLTVADSRKAEAVVDTVEEGFGMHPYKLQMAVCPTKNSARYEWFIEKATEMGVDTIVPVIGDHSERKVINTGRTFKLILSAAKQSLKALVPQLMAPVRVRTYLQQVPQTRLRLMAYCDESLDLGARQSMLEALEAYVPADGGMPEVSVLIGPEGDFSPEEVSLALSLGWQPVHLGTSRLRTETAALAAVAAVYLKYQ